ncbi:MAG: hypothetical protein GX443_01760 [Deltaproteobacteria bacterium]|nr:hypothetical protein [Deltaproteobacteria bacterium]
MTKRALKQVIAPLGVGSATSPKLALIPRTGVLRGYQPHRNSIEAASVVSRLTSHRKRRGERVRSDVFRRQRIHRGT